MLCCMIVWFVIISFLHCVGGRIYVQLPNGSTPIDIRIRENVSVTLDCGHLVTPSFERRNLNAIWKLRRRNFDGDLESGPLIFVPGTQKYTVIFLIASIYISIVSAVMRLKYLEIMGSFYELLIQY